MRRRIPLDLSLGDVMVGLEREVQMLESQVRNAAKVDAVEYAVTPGLTGLFAVAQRVARSPSRCVFIGGEAGNGKRVLAAYVHGASSRGHAPFISANLMTMAPSMMEQELFNSDGLVAAADGGTLLLHEITMLSHELQAKVLQLLQSRSFVAVDTQQEYVVDVRVIITSSCNLDGMGQALVREDLYYRMTAVQLHVPALRYRSDDILSLARHFAGGREFEPAAEAALLAYCWPENVRQLRDVVKAAAASNSEVVTVAQLKLPLASHDLQQTRPVPSNTLSSVNPAGPLARGSIATIAAVPSPTTTEFLRDLTVEAQPPVDAAPAEAESFGQKRRARTLVGVSQERLWHELERNGITK